MQKLACHAQITWNYSFPLNKKWNRKSQNAKIAKSRKLQDWNQISQFLSVFSDHLKLSMEVSTQNLIY